MKATISDVGAALSALHDEHEALINERKELDRRIKALQTAMDVLLQVAAQMRKGSKWPSNASSS